MTASEQAIHGETALHLAFAADRDDCVRYLLSAGADVEIKDRYMKRGRGSNALLCMH
jgi:ankyrin repeat protein